MANKKKRWSEHWDCCQKCGTTKIPYNALGLCEKCLNKLYNDFKRGKNKELLEWRKKYKRGRKIIEEWSKDYDCCTECGGTKFSHAGGGKCFRCYQRVYQKQHKAKHPRQHRRKSKIPKNENKVWRQCGICRKYSWMHRWQAFHPECKKRSKLYKFYETLPRGEYSIRRTG